MTYAVKALDNWELDVLGVPFTPGARDSDGEYFDANTNLVEDRYPSPPVVYYHGWDAKGYPAGEPAFIGRTISSEKRADGVWYRVALDKANEYAQRIWEAAKSGLARASTGSIAHLVRTDPDGHIRFWPVAELSLLDATEGRAPKNNYAVAIPVLKAVYQQAGITLPDEAEVKAEPEGAQAQSGTGTEPQSQSVTGVREMEPKEIQEMIGAALKADREAQAKEQEAKAKADAEAALKAENEALKAKLAEAGRLPTAESAPYVTQFNDRKYDNLDADDMAFLVGVLDAPTHDGIKAQRMEPEQRETALKSLAGKMVEAERKDSGPAILGIKALRRASKGAFKADEINRSTLASYGDEWVGVAYSQRLWEAIRQGTFVLAKMPAIEVPPGHESITIPLESADPQFYKVAQVANLSNGVLTDPAPTVPASRVGTDNQTMSLAKMGARVLWSGEMEEDSLIPWVSNLRRQLEIAGAETMEHVLIDGDTATANTTNINDIAGQPAGTEAFLLVDGFRKLGLVTNTANARDAGTLAVTDFLETLKLMGTAGKNAVQKDRVEFIIDPWTHYKALELPEVLSRDVFAAPTLENGVLNGIYGHRINVSWQMCAAGIYAGTVPTATYQYKSQSADGKVDQDTEADNVDGSILAVRWDQWLMGWRRRMTMETRRIANADATEIVALARWGLTYRDTEAAAISYGVTV